MDQDTLLSRGFPTAARFTRCCLILRVLVFHVVLLATFISFNCSNAQNTPVQQARLELSTASPAEHVEPVDWVFLIDTSASMSGRGQGNSNIFPRVQQTLGEFISALPDDDSLTLFAFDSTSREVSETKVIDPDRKSIVDEINKLSAEGDWTHTGAALSDALSHISSRNDPKRTAAIILFTDGKEDVTGILNPIRIPDAIKLIPDKNIPYVFYVSLGTALDPELSRFMDQINEKAARRGLPHHGFTFEDEGAKDLRARAESIRIIVRPPELQPTMEPKSLDFGQIQPGDESEPHSIDISSDTRIMLTLMPMGVPPEHHIIGLPDTLDVVPQQVQRVTFRVKVGEGATKGVQNFRLAISTPSGLGLHHDVPITLVVYEGLLTGIGKWISEHWRFLLLLLLALLILAFLLFLGWMWYRHDLTPLQILVIIWRKLFGKEDPHTAVLNNPNGDPIRLNKPRITLGRGGSKLPNSTTLIDIHREGAYHIVVVRKGSLVITNVRHDNEVRLEPSNRRRLEHNDQLKMPGYGTLTYLNSAKLH